jgi:hypothetical protein
MLNRCIASFLLLLSFLSFAAAAASVQQREILMAGGYSLANETDQPRLKQVAEFAVTQAVELQKYSFLSGNVASSGSSSTASGSSGTLSTVPPFKIAQAYQQVVAGMNYRMVILLQDPNNTKTCLGAFAVTVYDQFGNLSVTNWSPAGVVSCETAESLLAGKNVPEAGNALEAFFP